MKSLFLGLSLVSTLAFAETATISVEGMHCAGCKYGIKEKVCEAADAKDKYESCTVEFTNMKKQQGEIKITTKKDIKVDLAAIKEGVKAAGDDYKVTKEEVK